MHTRTHTHTHTHTHASRFQRIAVEMVPEAFRPGNVPYPSGRTFCDACHRRHPSANPSGPSPSRNPSGPRCRHGPGANVSSVSSWICCWRRRRRRRRVDHKPKSIENERKRTRCD